MAWYTINYVCGHADREQLYGKESERVSRIAWAERNKMCPACYQTEKDRLRLAETKAATEANASLVALKGSVAQIAWAEKIRAAASRLIAQVVGEYSGIAPTTEEMSAFGRIMLKQEEAKYWIDQRQNLTSVSAVADYISLRIKARKAQAEGAASLKLR